VDARFNRRYSYAIQATKTNRGQTRSAFSISLRKKELPPRAPRGEAIRLVEAQVPQRSHSSDVAADFVRPIGAVCAFVTYECCASVSL